MFFVTLELPCLPYNGHFANFFYLKGFKLCWTLSKKKKTSTGAGFKTGFSTRTSSSVHVVAAAVVDKLWRIVCSVSSNKSLFLEH